MELSESRIRSVVEEEVWVAGKGPSLDTYNWGNSNGCNFGLNEAAFLVPHCVGAFAVDTKILEKFTRQLALPTIVFIEHRKRFTYEKYFKFNRPKHFAFSGGVILVATQVLSYFGVKVIHFVGCDSITQRQEDRGYAKGIRKIKGQGTNNDFFKVINTRLVENLDKMGLEVVWEHTE